MKNLILLIMFTIACASCDTMPNKSNVYIMTQNLLEEKFKYAVNEIDFPMFDYGFDDLKDSTYIVVSYFTYKNEFNVEKKFGYKAKVKYNGGAWEKSNNWELIYVNEYNY